ncbi:hypothetical protein DFH29DRAFT_1004991 [Suillus ampliporus]|nr:hypothetical protein DFH29DRAFT_1004991 [Suillus ampliporus]
MLALLFPWCDLQDIKAAFNDFEAAFVSFSEAASQTDKDVLMHVQYYYECKAAAFTHHESDDEAPEADTSNCRNQGSIDSDSEDDEMQIELMEADLLAYKESQTNNCEELHGLMAIAAAWMKKIFGDEHHNWTCELRGVSIAHGADYIRLQQWQSKMSEDIATLNRDDPLAPQDPDNAGDVAIISDEELVSDHDGDHGVKQMSALQQEDQDHLSAIDPSHLLKDQRCAYNVIDWHLAETLAG